MAFSEREEATPAMKDFFVLVMIYKCSCLSRLPMMSRIPLVMQPTHSYASFSACVRRSLLIWLATIFFPSPCRPVCIVLFTHQSFDTWLLNLLFPFCFLRIALKDCGRDYQVQVMVYLSSNDMTEG